MLASWPLVVAAAAAVSASPWSSLPLRLKDGDSDIRGQPPLSDDDLFHDMFMALADMQDIYFQRWLGTWPGGIDWTKAVASTHVAATLRTISDALELSVSSQPAACVAHKEEVISGYFADIIAYYFAEDAFAIRNQAFDDMLWVVLGWLESIQFVNEHNRFVSSMGPRGDLPGSSSSNLPGPGAWYGSRWTPAFAHRARIFWELAAKGWDTKLCGGGMVWNPRLMPYKNAITNELFIAASAGMFLHFPGDANPAPYNVPSSTTTNNTSTTTIPWKPHDPAFLASARDAHAWLATSNMTNAQGLYADGFHISGAGNSTACDTRDEMVYTYNQGVLLSGLLGLAQAAGVTGTYTDSDADGGGEGGAQALLEEGHKLVRSVINATGWDIEKQAPVDPLPSFLPVPGDKGALPPWHGLGRAGVLEDACDAWGTCSQDAQTFKGIWMHHFAVFCGPDALSSSSSLVGDDDGADEIEGIRARLAADCRRYLPWLRHNALAALGTKDARGRFGMWWTAGLLGQDGNATAGGVPPAGSDFSDDRQKVLAVPEPTKEEHPREDDGGQVVDYRNFGVPRNARWMRQADLPSSSATDGLDQKPLGDDSGGHADQEAGGKSSLLGRRGAAEDVTDGYDPNLRGRGRTLETQTGGLAVLRALWVVSRQES